jgi:hypothetical protein
LPPLKSDDRLFWDQRLCVAFDVHLRISSPGIDEAKFLSITFIRIIVTIFVVHLQNIRFLQGYVIPTTKLGTITDRDASFLLAKDGEDEDLRCLPEENKEL